MREAGGVVLPGVGAMPKAMERVRELALDRLLRERVEAGVPVIGLCMGMQLLFESTTELGGAEGIGLLRGPVEALDAPGLKVPQIGWNPVSWRRESPLTDGPAVAVRLLPRELVRAAAGGRRRRARHRRVRQRVRERGGAAARLRPPVAPEKSGPDGLRLLKNFVSLAAAPR